MSKRRFLHVAVAIFKTKTRMRVKQLNLDKAIIFILFKMYGSEFEIIDRLSQHPEGINFYEWLYTKALIEKEELDRIQKEIQLEEDQEMSDAQGYWALAPKNQTK